MASQIVWTDEAWNPSSTRACRRWPIDERCAIRMTMADGRQAAWPIIFADVAAADQYLADVCQEKRHQDRMVGEGESWWTRAGVQLHSLRIEYIRVQP